MCRSVKLSWIAVAGFLALAGCANSSGDGTATVADPACVRKCDAAMDACSLDCENQVDNDLCAQECIDKHEKCKSRC